METLRWWYDGDYDADDGLRRQAKLIHEKKKIGHPINVLSTFSNSVRAHEPRNHFTLSSLNWQPWKWQVTNQPISSRTRHITTNKKIITNCEMRDGENSHLLLAIVFIAIGQTNELHLCVRCAVCEMCSTFATQTHNYYYYFFKYLRHLICTPIFFLILFFSIGSGWWKSVTLDWHTYCHMPWIYPVPSTSKCTYLCVAFDHKIRFVLLNWST